MNAEAVKGETVWLRVGAKRELANGRSQIVVTLAADPRIEAFFKAFGRAHTADEYGVTDLVRVNKPLSFYQLDGQAFRGTGYIIDAITIGFRNGNPQDQPIVSVLRAKGIGEPDGVSFGLTKGYSSDYIKEWLAALAKTTKTIVKSNISPFSYGLKVIE